MGTFGLDIHQDLLSAVTGVPTDERLGTRLYGKDAAGLRVDIEARSLGLIAERLEQLFQEDAYKEHFPWVDNIAEITGAAEIRSLNDALVGALRGSDSHQFDLAPPEIVDWSRAEGYVYKRGAEIEPELTLAAYLESVRPRDELSLDVLRNDRVQLVDADGNRMSGWSVYRCVTGELIDDDSVHVISDGKWYEVSRDFAAEVDEAVAALAGDAIDLPPYSMVDGDEGEYNERVARESEGGLVCMDEKFVWPRSWQDRIEFCDLYRADRRMIHVKRYAKGSATLSHLFAQGSVSTRCLLTDRPFVADVDTHLPAGHWFNGVPEADTCHTVFAIIAPPGRNLVLPFFSRVALRNSAEAIENLGAHVSFQVIENQKET